MTTHPDTKGSSMHGDHLFDIKQIENTPFNDMLSFLIDTLRTNINDARPKLKSISGPNETAAAVVNLLSIVELVLTHLEFTSDALQTETDAEIAAVKEKYRSIKDQYETVILKSDLTPYPAKYALYIIYTRMYPKLKKTLADCFKKGFHGETRFIDSKENTAQARVARERFKYASDNYRYIINMHKDDIFRHEQSSPVWQDLYKSVVIKNIVTKEEIDKETGKMNLAVQLGYLLARGCSECKNGYSGAFSMLKNLAYYALNSQKIEMDSNFIQLEPNLEQVVSVWNFGEHPSISRFAEMRHEKVGYNQHIHIPKLFPKITRQSILKEYEEKTFNKLQTIQTVVPTIFHNVSDRITVLKELFVPSKEKVSVRVLAWDSLNLKERIKEGLTSKPASKKLNDETAIVIDIHGGAFVALSSLTHKAYLTKWVKSLKLVHFAIDYRLAPENPYPDAVDDVWQAYLWIINYAETILGIKTPKVIVAGDSAGGNLALCLSLRLIRAGLKPPHGCLLLYPSLHLDPYRSSPSRFMNFDNPFLPPSFLQLIREAYIGVDDEVKFMEDPLISPMMASDELLMKLPPIRITVGTQDFLHDECWRFFAKLRNMNKDIKLTIYDKFPHGFTFNESLKNYGVLMEDHCDLIRELIEIP